MEAPNFTPGSGLAETADQVGDGVAILPDRQAREFHPGRLVPSLGDLGIEGFVDIVRDGFRLFAHAGPRVVLRHRLLDIPGQLRDRAIPGEGLLIFFGSLAARPMAR